MRFTSAGLAYEKALAIHVLRSRSSGGGSSSGVAAQAEAAMRAAENWMKSGDFGRALETIRSHFPASSLPPAAQAIALRFSSDLHECMGDYVTSLSRFMEAKKLEGGKGGKGGKGGTGDRHQSLDHALRHAELLRRILRQRDEEAPLRKRGGSAAASSRALPAKVADAMEAELDKLTRVLLRHGPWRSKHQMPKRYLPGLAPAMPFHRLKDWPALKRIVAKLKAAWPALAREYRSLKATASLLQKDHECIMSSRVVLGRGKAAAAGGGVGDAGGAAKEGGDGAEGAEGNAASGGLNKQKKATTKSCARLTVGLKTKAWREGKVLFFDDSFLHEAVNHCASERVVFQLVIAHPGVMRMAAEAAKAKAEGRAASDPRVDSRR
eukprot:g250.t1